MGAAPDDPAGGAEELGPPLWEPPAYPTHAQGRRPHSRGSEYLFRNEASDSSTA